MTSLIFDSLIQTRYARTKVSSTVQNDASSPRLFNFTFVIPETAVVSTVSLTLNGVQYFSRPIQKEGQVINTPTPTSAGISVRDATQFGVRLTLAARSNVVFSLTYEELLTKQMSEYTHKVHISPGQVVPHLEVRIRITEPTEITALDLKPFTNDITSASAIKASILKWSGGEAEVQYIPTVTEQIQMAELFQENPEAGLNGYLAISYDVLSPAPAGQLFVHNNYFVHFFSPTLWSAIPKHALFVLDVSGSMSGVKIQQLKDALVSILNHLDASDSFTVVEFSSSYKIWDLDGTDTLNCHTYQATSDRISAALSKARAMQAGGGTSLNAALQKALKCTSLQSKLDPILVVLTDGQATDASSSTILANVKAANVNTNIYSLAFGRGADFNFLHSLAHGNGGKAHIIYEGKDAAQQLEDFYSSISTPLLMDVSFNYGDMVDVSTKTCHCGFRLVSSRLFQ
ncbi:inter-alpha-trypsin inhibitor heavy chain H4-like [Thrips palmi]|uniref:Inter-alpha-trypsin inhibitor heavy chain H4-like n=1 Tax=Thrips palmi TaxID=161013 RepID=A0A6P8ZQE9_THRPL|nr:inter-alpha-trypsin inhibitor heavy chain H4-like [Thrips palmi]